MKIKKNLIYIFLGVTSILTLVPFIWMISASFMADGKASVFPPVFWPDEFVFSQYQNLFVRLNIFSSTPALIRNSQSVLFINGKIAIVFI